MPGRKKNPYSVDGKNAQVFTPKRLVDHIMHPLRGLYVYVCQGEMCMCQ